MTVSKKKFKKNLEVIIFLSYLCNVKFKNRNQSLTLIINYYKL